ncbi:Starch-binding associating with outer membrane [Zhouia amylolytica]|uniref:RagB/SusD family nutrient uptake outer membrane protein n=2 Tax=Zhouia amylolytica TaxID=376730 RepID=W2UIR0_9FLAO|nr:RagB/SusD family nutrient uptake outer membrane protein [Zhouia amylolytica]ETN93898.1 hypothetical protein P278_33080 [Zhouia amylolytica AD3]MCQ0112892.1 RagB/SusD family nutrient uptake outer membrane protein [Zhouia amylolytica]SFS33012.1 Starch-binding associating with outer membrane [Zhouia amylolytica]
MKTRFKTTNRLLLVIAFSFMMLSTSCDEYLDIVPDDVSTLDDAFNRPNEALNFLYSVYGFMPQENDMFSSIALWGTDEMVTPWDRSWYHAKRMMRGELNASDPFFDYWTAAGSIDMYDGIRQAYIFLNNIDKTPDFSQAEVRRMKGEATFLIGYYHFILLRQYGPIVLMENEVPLDASGEDFYAPRIPYDQCVEFIAQKFDEAYALLPNDVSTDRELGRVNKAIAKALKARVLLYAASPLFNGNSEFYADFTGHDGTPLMNTSYDEQKWVLAADANKDAIEAAQTIGHDLYAYSNEGDNEMEQGALNYRYSMVDPWNKEVVWGYSVPEGYYGWQRHSIPRISSNSYNGQSCSLSMVETFYTENGLPIDVDPAYNYSARFQMADSTIILHRNREPRFYATVGFDRGLFEVNNTEVVLKMRMDEAHGWANGLNDYSPTGYLVKKGVHPQTIISSSENQVINYPWPLVRMAELYLNYAEALNEAYGAARHAEVIQYLDLIRERSNVPGVLEAWSLVGKSSFSKEEMRAIIQQERNIELCYEGHRTWDVRRWKQGEMFNVPAQGLDIRSSEAVDFYKPVNVENRVFTTPGYYLFPIRLSEVEINQNLVQNPGW